MSKTARTATMLFLAQPVTTDAKHRLARYDRVQFACGPEVLADPGNLLGPQNWSFYTGLADEIRAINPLTKVDVYSGGMASPDVYHPLYEALADEDMVHRLDGSRVELVAHVPPLGGERNMRTINYSRPATRAKLIERWIAFLRANHFDAMDFDSYNSPSYAGFFRDVLGCPTGALEGAVHTDLFWATNLTAFAQEMKAALEPLGLAIFANGLEQPGVGYNFAPFNPADPAQAIMGEEFTRISTYVTAALAEACHRIYFDSTWLTLFIAMAGRVNALHGGVFYFFQPNLFNNTDPDTHIGDLPIANSSEIHRYYLCAYLLVATDTTLFGYHDQEAYRGFTPDGVVYVFDGGADWDLDLGPARSGVQWSTAAAGKVAYREYANAYVLANADTSYGWFAVRGTYRAWHPTTGALSIVSVDSPGIPVPPKTGLILFKQATPIPWSQRMRARLQHIAMDEDGDVKPGRAVTVYKSDGVTLFDQVMYDAPSGGNVVTNPTVTNQQGLLQVYTPRGQRVKLAISGLAGQYDSEFLPDPADVFQFGQDALMTAAGDAAPVLTITPTVGGPGGNKGLLIKNADGTTALEVKPHGVSGAPATEVGLIAPVLVIRHAATKPRIYADLTAVARMDRLLVMTTAVGGNSDLGVAPNGGTEGALTAYSRAPATSDQTAAVRLKSNAAGAFLETFAIGLTAQDLIFSPNQVEKLRVQANGSVQMAPSGIATNATSGFFYICTAFGPPTGVPVVGATTPLMYDSANNKLYSYNGGAWRSVTFT